jgi:hypothetical protein
MQTGQNCETLDNSNVNKPNIKTQHCPDANKSLHSRGFKLLPSQGWFQTIADPTISSGGFKLSLFQPFQVVVASQP